MGRRYEMGNVTVHPRRAGWPMRRAAALLALAVLGAIAPPDANAQAVRTDPAEIVAPPDSGARPITLEEAVALAQENAPSAVQARGELRTAAAGSRSSYAAFLPNVSITSGATRQYGTEAGGTRVENGQVITVPSEPWSYTGSIGGNLEIFDGGRRYFSLREARANTHAAQANEVSQRYAAALDAKQQYFNILAAREAQAAAKVQLEEAEVQLRSAVGRVRARTATRSDSLRAEILVRNGHLAVMDADHALDAAEAGLTRAVGTSYPVTAALADPGDELALLFEADSLKQLAVKGPMVQQAEAQLDAARALRRSAWTNYLPTLAASYSRNRSGVSSEFGWGPDDYDYSGALRLSVALPLFDQLGREEQIVRAKVAEANAEAGLRDSRLTALQSLTTALGSFRSATQRIAAQTATVEAAEEDLRVQQQRYTVGNSTLLDVLASQSQLNQARRELIRARYDRRVAKAELELVVGRDL